MARATAAATPASNSTKLIGSFVAMVFVGLGNKSECATRSGFTILPFV